MPDYTRSEYLKIMFGNNSASSGVNNFTAPSQINDLGGASIDETSLAVQHASEDMSQYMNEAQKASTESKGRAEQRNGWQRFSDTTQDMVNDVTQGFLGFFDSIGDLALNSFEAWGWMDENKAEQYKNTDWMAPVQKALGFIDGSALRSGDMFTSDYWTSWSPEEARAYIDMQDQSSYTSQMDSGLNNFGKGILVNFGNMIPSMLASLLPGGQALSLATLGAGAFASNTNEQYERNKQENYGNGDRGKQFGRAALGGAADAAVEVGTEILVGKALGLVGKGLSKGASKLTGKNINIRLVNPESNVGGFNVSKQMVDRLREGSAKFVPYLLRTMNEEGAEEVVSGILDPVVDYIGGASKDEAFGSKEGKINRYADVSFWLTDQNSVAMQGLSGAVSGGIMGAMSQARSYNYAKSLNIGKDGVNALVELDDIKEGLHSDNYKSQAEVDSAITSFANHLMNGSMTTTQKKNFLRLINDPAGYMADVTEKQISDAVDNYARKYSDTDNLIASDLVDTLNTTFGKNYTLQFSDDPKMADKANVNFLTKTITLNEKYKNQYSELIAHEYLGHIATDTLTKSQASRIAGEIKSTQWWKDNRDVLEKAYSEFTADGKENEFNSELIANWLEDVISDGNTNGNLKTSAVLNELLSYRGIKEKLLQKLKHTDADNLLKNDSILSEYMKGVNKVLSRGDRFGGRAKADSAYEDYILGKAGMQTKYAAKEWDSNRLKKITNIAARDYGMNNSNPGFSFGKNFKSKGFVNDILAFSISLFSTDINGEKFRKDPIISAFKSGEAYLEEAGGAYFRGHIDDDGGIVIDSISDESKPLEEEKAKVSAADAKQSAPTPSATATPAAPAGKNYDRVTSVDVSGDFASMAKPFDNDTNKLLDWLSKNVKGNKDVLKELDEKGTAKIGDITVTGSVTETMAKITDVKQDSVQQVQQTTQVQQVTKPLDKKAKTVRQSKESSRNNGKASTKPEDDFGRIQEESRKQFNLPLRERVFAANNEGIRQRLSTVLQRELERRGFNASNRSALNLKSSHSTEFTVFENVDGQTFHDVFEVARAYTINGELVDLHPAETNSDSVGYSDTTNYLSSDGLSGFAITKDGDLISVFNAGSKRGWLDAISGVVKEKAKTLDCYVSSRQNLQEMYAKKFGFKTASLMDWNQDYDHDDIGKNHGEPKVAFMVNSDSNVETKNFGKNEYDAAKDYQMSFLKKETESLEKKASKPRGTSITLLAKVKNSVLASKAFADENSLKSFLNKEIRGSDDVRNRLMNDGKAEINGYEVTAHKTAKGNLVIDDIKSTQVTESTTESTGSKSESVSDASNIEKTAEAEEKGNEEVQAPKKEEETKETQSDSQIVPKVTVPHTITELAESIPEQASNEEYRKALNDFIGRLSKEERGVLIGDAFDNDEDAQSNYKGELVDGKYKLVFNASDYEEEYKRWSGNPNSSSHAPKPEDYVSLQYANEDDTSTQSQTASSGSIVPPSIGESASQSTAESSVPELTYHETKKDAFYDDPRYIKMWADLHAKKKIDKTTVREFIENLSHVLQAGSEIEFSDHSAEWAQEVFKYINTIGSENDRAYAIHDLATEIVRQIASDANLSHEDNIELLDNMTKAVEAEVRKLVQVSSMDTYRSQMEQRVRTWQTRYHNLVVRSQMWNECRNKEGTLYNFYNRTNQKNLSPEEVAVSQSFKGIAPKNPASRSGLTPTPSLVKNFAYAAENYRKLGEEVKRRASANETPLLYVHDEQLQKDLDYLHDWFMQNSHKIDESGPDTLDNRQLNSNMRTQALPNEVIEKMTNVYGGILGMFNDAAVERRSRALKAATTANVVTEQSIKTSAKKKHMFNFIRKVRDLAMSPVTYLETYLGKEHPFTKLFRDDFTKARVAMQSRDLEYSNAINEVLESNGVRGRDFRKKVDFAGQRMTKDTLASIYMTIRTRENDIFADGEKHKFSLVDDSGSHKTFIEVSTDDLKVIEQLLTPNELKAVNEITEKVQAMSRPQYEEYYRKSYGLEPNTIEGIYFATRADTGQAKIDNLNDGNTHSPYLTTAGAGYSKSRKGGNATILRIKGFASTINGYYRDLDYRTTHFEAVEKARVLLNTKINGQTLSQRLGQVLPYWNTGENQWSQYILGIMVNQREWANQNDVFTKLTGKAQSAVLGLNLSPVLKQFLSGFTTMGEVGVTNYAKALPKMAYNLAHFKEAKAEMLKSIDSFRVRVEDQGALKGEISSDAISTIQKYCGAMMEKTDTANNVICVYSIAQVMADSGMGDVGEIFTSLLYRTQSNNMATWVSPLRSGYAGAITRMIFGIFGADNQNKLDLAMQVTSEFSNARRRRADYDAVLSDPNLDPNTRAEVESLRNESAKTYSAGEERKKAIGLSVALLLNGLFATAIADLMKRILGKKDWDEPTDAGEFAKDVAFESTLGWVPYIGTIASAVRNNTDASIITLDQINEVLQGAESLSKALSSRDPNAIGKEGSILAARITETLSGIPVNNIYRYSRGIAKGVGNIFGNGQKIYYSKAFSWYANYSSAGMLDNFKKQVGRGNISMGADTLGALYDSYKLGAPSREDMVAVSKLYQSGHTDILPKSVPDYYTNKEGEKKDLTQSQKDTFVKNYKGANDVVNIILKRPSIADEQKAKAIKRVYDAYYEYAKAKLTGDEPDSKLAKMIASGLFSPQDLAKAMEVYSIACDMKETSRASRKAQVVNLVNRSGLTRVQKLYLMSYLGYTLDDSAQKMLDRYVKQKTAH